MRQTAKSALIQNWRSFVTERKDKRGAPIGNERAKKPEGEGKETYIHFRCLSADKGRWVAAAQRNKQTLSEFMHQAANQLADRIFND